MHRIVLLLGMFLIAISIEKSGLYKKITLLLITVLVTAETYSLGLMISTVPSMIVLSTTVVLVMLSIAQVITNVIARSNQVIQDRRFTLELILGIAYASSKEVLLLWLVHHLT